MSIERQKGKMTLMCDRCEETLDDWFTPDSFDAMMFEAKEYGWYTAKTEDGWEHICPDCLNIRLKK